MVAATNSVRAVPRKAAATPHMPSIPLSIAPRGNRSLVPTVQRARRIKAKNTRDYSKTNDDMPQGDGFDVQGI